jgi:hypothetical protein
MSGTRTRTALALILLSLLIDPLLLLLLPSLCSPFRFRSGFSSLTLYPSPLLSPPSSTGMTPPDVSLFTWKRVALVCSSGPGRDALNFLNPLVKDFPSPISMVATKCWSIGKFCFQHFATSLRYNVLVIQAVMFRTAPRIQQLP